MGQSVSLNGAASTVTGVLPRDFVFPSRAADIYVPIASSTTRGAAGAPSVGAYGRLKPGVPIERAQAEIDGISRQLDENFRHCAGLRYFRTLIASEPEQPYQHQL